MNREYWLTGKDRGTGYSMRTQMRYVGRRHFNPDKLINSALGDKILETYNFWALTDYDEDAPETYEYWRSVGIKKELHNKDVYAEKWSVHIPLEAYEPENAGKKYPVFFVLHGGANPLFDGEFYGFSHLGVKEGFISVYPQDRSPQTIRAIWEKCKELYPVDESRVYVTGFSEGGVRCMNVSIRCWDIFAASAHCGVHVMLSYDTIEKELDDELREKGLPSINIFGEEEPMNHQPYSALEENDNCWFFARLRGAIPKLNMAGKLLNMLPEKGADSDEEKLRRFNRRLYVSGCKTVTAEDCAKARKNERNIVEEKLGVPCENSKILVRYEKEHYIADFKNDEGVTMFRACCIEDMPHVCHYDQAELAWNFVSRFSKDPETGALVIHKEKELY